MSRDVIILKKMMTETSAEIDDVFIQPTGVGLYDCHIEGLSFLLIHKLRVIPDTLEVGRLTHLNLLPVQEVSR